MKNNENFVFCCFSLKMMKKNENNNNNLMNTQREREESCTHAHSRRKIERIFSLLLNFIR